jgi:hypothetical protein
MLKPLKRWPVLLALVVVLGGLAVGLVFLPGGRVTRENCQRIKEGMTEAEVRAILGKPWDDSLFDPEGASFRASFSGSTPWKYSRHWIGDDCVILVSFGDNGRAWCPVFIPDPDITRSSLPARVWRRLHARYGW